MKVYLSGRVEGLKDKGQTWRTRYAKELRSSPHPIESINVMANTPDLVDPMAIVKYDADLIRACDCLLVNANIPFSMGTPIEMTIAKYFSKLVIAVVGEESPYYQNTYDTGLDGHRVNAWIHPFLVVFSDHIVSTVEAARRVLTEYAEKIRLANPKTLNSILQ